MDSKNEIKTEEKITRPDDLSKYLRVARPPVWFALVAILLLLVGAIVWGASYSFETKVDGFAAATPEGTGVCYVLSQDISSIVPGITVRMGDQEATIRAVSERSAPAGDVLSEYLLLQSGFQKDDQLFILTLDQAPDTEFARCSVIVESVSPIDLLFHGGQ